MTREDVIKKLDSGDKDFRFKNLSNLDLSFLNFTGADLSGADLSGAILRGAILCVANLSGAVMRGAIMDDDTDIDYACWPLWCGGLHVKIAKRQACQLAYHFCSQDCDDPEYIEARNAILKFANRFHRANECGILEPR